MFALLRHPLKRVKYPAVCGGVIGLMVHCCIQNGKYYMGSFVNLRKHDLLAGSPLTEKAEPGKRIFQKNKEVHYGAIF